MDQYPQEFCEDQWALRKLVEKSFATEDLVVYEERVIKYFSLVKYLPYDRLFEWEEFVLGMHLGVYWKEDNTPRWSDLFCLIGRGAGKDGVISLESLALISPYNPVPQYDIDICANNEDQAVRPVTDITDALNSMKAKMKKFFKWTQEYVKGLKNGGRIKGHTNNAKGKDGLRSGAVIFNEYHAYENVENVNVFTTGLGKKADARRSIFTTNGDVVEGPLDELIADSEAILYEGAPDNGLLPFLCRLDNREEVYEEINWRKANPSLRYRPSLLKEIRKEFIDWQKNPARLTAFLTKRMNIRETVNQLPVALWEHIQATNKQYDQSVLKYPCVVGIDFSKTTDWASVNVHYKIGDDRIDYNHAWICTSSENKELSRLKCPWKQWVDQGYLTEEKGAEISAKTIANYIKELKKTHRIIAICVDSYRYDYLKDALKEIGFSYELKNIKLTRPSDVIRKVPIINTIFINGLVYWGDNPVLRWATNNAKLVRVKKSTLAIEGEADFGNFMIGKIEPKTRKTDPFMAVVHSIIGEDFLPQQKQIKRTKYNDHVYTYH